MSERSKPAGLVVIALYSALCGLAAVPIGCTASLVAGVPGAAAFSVVGLFITALGVFLLASAYGLWTLQPWGRSYTWWLYVACIPLGVLAIFPVFPGHRMSAGNTIMQVLGIAIDIVVLVYLSKPEVQNLFGLDAEQSSFADYARREPYLKREPNS